MEMRVSWKGRIENIIFTNIFPPVLSLLRHRISVIITAYNTIDALGISSEGRMVGWRLRSI